MSIRSNIETINRQKAEACLRVGRDPEEVRLIAVTKLHEPEEINEAIACGVTDIAENKVQEILRKYDAVDPVRWHLIGHLQTNKVRQVIDKVCMIHSVDSLHLAQEIDKRAAQHGLVMDILLQVNIAEEESKFGINEEALDGLVRDITETCPNVRIRGLMCIAPFEEDPEQVRPCFREAKRLFDLYAAQEHTERLDFKYLSMGVTNDFQVAVEEGSNMIRVGTAIFGIRDYRSEEK